MSPTDFDKCRAEGGKIRTIPIGKDGKKIYAHLHFKRWGFPSG